MRANLRRRSQRARRVHRCAGKGYADQVHCSQREADSEVLRVRRALRHDQYGHHKDHREKCFTHESTESVYVLGVDDGDGPGNSVLADNGGQRQARQHAADDLRNPIADDVRHRDPLIQEHAEGHCRIEVASRNAPDRVEPGHQGQTKRKRDLHHAAA